MGVRMKAGLIAALFLVVLIGWLLVKLALIRTAILFGGTLFMVGLLLFVAAVAVAFIALRSRGARA
jgi:hypothetical protein